MGEAAPSNPDRWDAIDLELRPLEVRDIDDVAVLLRSTIALGRPLPRPLDFEAEYAKLCLRWYVGPGRSHAAVVEQDGAIVGYAFVCVEETSYHRSIRRATGRFAVRLTWAALTGRMTPWSVRFYWSRGIDSVMLARRHLAAPMPAHAHLNIATDRRTGRAAVLLRDHIDRTVASAGLEGWYGEVNARRGSRQRALERLGLVVLDRERNRTMSKVLGTDVDRLIIQRRLGDPIVTDSSSPRGSRKRVAGRA